MVPSAWTVELHEHHVPDPMKRSPSLPGRATPDRIAVVVERSLNRMRTGGIAHGPEMSEAYGSALVVTDAHGTIGGTPTSFPDVEASSSSRVDGHQQAPLGSLRAFSQEAHANRMASCLKYRRSRSCRISKKCGDERYRQPTFSIIVLLPARTQRWAVVAR